MIIERRSKRSWAQMGSEEAIVFFMRIRIGKRKIKRDVEFFIACLDGVPLVRIEKIISPLLFIAGKCLHIYIRRKIFRELFAQPSFIHLAAIEPLRMEIESSFADYFVNSGFIIEGVRKISRLPLHFLIE